MDLVGIAGICGTLAAAIITQVFMTFREKQRLELEIKRFEIEHPHILESEIKCRFHGPVSGSYMAVITIEVQNRSSTLINISSMRLRLRGIQEESDLSLFDAGRRGARVAFPLKIVDEELVPRGYSSFVLVGGVKQEFTFATIVSSDILYLLVNASLVYEGRAKNTLERIFEVGGNTYDLRVKSDHANRLNNEKLS